MSVAEQCHQRHHKEYTHVLDACPVGNAVEIKCRFRNRDCLIVGQGRTHDVG